MKCRGCNNDTRPLLPSDITAHQLISKRCNVELAKHVFNIHICQCFHTTIECRKCGTMTQYFDIAMTHYINCSRNIAAVRYSHVLYLKGSIVGQPVFLSVQSAIDVIPQLLVLDIDYVSAFKNEHDIKSNIWNISIINGRTNEMDKAIEIIKRQLPSCNICYMVYETFPSLEVVLRHVARCFATGSVGTNFVRSLLAGQT